MKVKRIMLKSAKTGLAVITSHFFWDIFFMLIAVAGLVYLSLTKNTTYPSGSWGKYGIILVCLGAIIYCATTINKE